MHVELLSEESHYKIMGGPNFTVRKSLIYFELRLS